MTAALKVIDIKAVSTTEATLQTECTNAYLNAQIVRKAAAKYCVQAKENSKREEIDREECERVGLQNQSWFTKMNKIFEHSETFCWLLEGEEKGMHE